jgi:hypothetical protein
MDSLYEELNQISNDEFDTILKKSPIQDYLGVSFENHLACFKEKKNDNVFIVETKDKETKEVFVKYITLIDFLKFLIGKYKNENLDIMPCEPTTHTNSKYEKYINDTNNYAYVDSFFYHATSEFAKKTKFPHSIECYDQFVCKKKNCKINIADDLEYLCDSNYFNENINKLYHFEDQTISNLFMSTQKEKLVIEKENDVILEDIELLGVEDIEEKDEKKEEVREASQIVQVDGGECEDNDDEGDEEDDEDDEDESSDDSDVMHTSDSDEEEEGEEEEDEEGEEEEGEDEEGEEEDSDEEYSEEEDEEDSDEEDDDDDDVFLYIHKIPTQVLVLEKCDNTLDYLLENDLLQNEELESAMFQIVTILYTYQKVFQFTHNDLHTNNIMYVTTEETHLTYRIMGKVYKVPTFGKIYKIIDFGRSIYTYKGKLLCSDSFSSNGTAHTQYNFGPYYNPKKPVIEPNYSFDLCRLACSIFDFVCDDINHIKTYRKDTPIHDLIFSWLYDDNGRNMLYRSNGDDKYPGFKLYKMISKIVHGHLPEKQYGHPCFKKFLVDKSDEANDETIVDIDCMQLKTTAHS